MINLYELPNLSDTEIIKLFKKDGSFVVLAEHNVLGGICDSCQCIDGFDFVRFEVIDLAKEQNNG